MFLLFGWISSCPVVAYSLYLCIFTSTDLGLILLAFINFLLKETT